MEKMFFRLKLAMAVKKIDAFFPILQPWQSMKAAWVLCGLAVFSAAAHSNQPAVSEIGMPTWAPPASAPAYQPVRRAGERSCPPPVPKLTPEILAAVQRNAKDVGPLWRIEKDGQVSWLYGTIHEGRIEWLFPGPGVFKAMSEVDTVAVETVNMEQLYNPQEASRISGIELNEEVQSASDILELVLLEKHFCFEFGALSHIAKLGPNLWAMWVFERNTR